MMQAHDSFLLQCEGVIVDDVSLDARMMLDGGTRRMKITLISSWHNFESDQFYDIEMRISICIEVQSSLSIYVQ